MARDLYIWVEGEDDRRLIDRVFVAHLERSRPRVKVETCAQTTKTKVRQYLRSMRSMDADVIWIADIDLAPCVTKRKDRIRRALRAISDDRVFVVVREIEGWYLAGLGGAACREFGIQEPSHTDDLTKEQFNDLVPRRFVSARDFKIEVLSRFSLDAAKQKNRSFRYFADRLGL